MRVHQYPSSYLPTPAPLQGSVEPFTFAGVHRDLVHRYEVDDLTFGKVGGLIKDAATV